MLRLEPFIQQERVLFQPRSGFCFQSLCMPMHDHNALSKPHGSRIKDAAAAMAVPQAAARATWAGWTYRQNEIKSVLGQGHTAMTVLLVKQH